MNKERFQELLVKANLSKKELANILGISPQSVSNWSVKGYPYWLESWLQNYIKAKAIDNLKDVICDDPSPIGNKSDKK